VSKILHAAEKLTHVYRDQGVSEVSALIARAGEDGPFDPADPTPWCWRILVDHRRDTGSRPPAEADRSAEPAATAAPAATPADAAPPVGSPAADPRRLVREVERAAAALDRAQPRRFSDRRPTTELRRRAVDIVVDLIRNLHGADAPAGRQPFEDGIRQLRNVLSAQAAADRHGEVGRFAGGQLEALGVPPEPLGTLTAALSRALDDAARPDPTAAVDDHVRAAFTDLMAQPRTGADPFDHLLDVLTRPAGLDPRVGEAASLRRAVGAALAVDLPAAAQRRRSRLADAALRPKTLVATTTEVVLAERPDADAAYRATVRSRIHGIQTAVRRILTDSARDLRALRPVAAGTDLVTDGQHILTDVRTILDQALRGVAGILDVATDGPGDPWPSPQPLVTAAVTHLADRHRPPASPSPDPDPLPDADPPGDVPGGNDPRLADAPPATNRDSPAGPGRPATVTPRPGRRGKGERRAPADGTEP
jgi:hypothetical protein